MYLKSQGRLFTDYILLPLPLQTRISRFQNVPHYQSTKAGFIVSLFRLPPAPFRRFLARRSRHPRRPKVKLHAISRTHRLPAHLRIGNARPALHRSSLLRASEADILAVQPVLGRTDIAAADHRFPSIKLAARYQSQRAAPRARHHGYERILRVTHLGLVFQHENRSGVHSFRYPFFHELQVG